MILHLNSIIIFCQDISLLKQFYTGVFELEIVEEIPLQWLVLKAGNCNIALHKIDDQYLDQNKAGFKAESNTKIVFETVDDLYTLRQELLAKAVLVKEILTWDGYDYLLCDGEDPEGNVFQLKQKKK